MSNTPNMLGWVRNDRAIDAFCQTLSKRSQNGQIAFGAAKPEFKGAWQRLVDRGIYGVFLHEAEIKLFGKTLPADSQRNGTCVSRGTYRACQDSYYNQIAQTGQVAKPVQFCFETIYPGARVNIRKGQLGYSEGAYGCDAAEWVHDFGMLPRGKYGQYDFTKAREDIAVDLGNPGRGVPRELIEACKPNLVDSCYHGPTIDDIADSIASLHAVAFCSGFLWQIPDGQSTSRDKDGMCRPVTSGGHCEEARAVWIDYRDRLCFGRQQSWGDYPKGPNVVRLKDGREVELPMGMYGAFADDMQDALRGGGGDVWAFGGIKGPRPGSTAEFLK